MQWGYLWMTVFLSSFSPTREIEQSDAINYLSRYGYLSPNKPQMNTLLNEETFIKAIADFQNFAGLPVTGKLDEETKYLMALPRCGLKDKNDHAQNRRKRSTVKHGTPWRVKNLNYRVSKYIKKLEVKKVDTEFENAFKVWSQHTDLKFMKKSGRVHIDIRFEKGKHGDGDPFDGPGGVLAHAAFPSGGGDVHFDETESWTFNSRNGTNLFQVAAHEFGHALGLDHSPIKGALMAPFYRGYEPNFKLHEDDIKQIQSLYGKMTNNTPKPSPEGSNSNNILCSNDKIKIDTIFNSAQGDTYVFKGDKYWKLTKDSIAPGYPKAISSRWRGLTRDFDAAFTHNNRKSYFFKGTKYWKYTGTTLDKDYPKEISYGFPGIPNNIDSVFYTANNNKVYFFKGSKYWVFEPSQSPQVKTIYPKPISDFGASSQDIDATFQDKTKEIFLFKQGQYWRIDDKNMKVAKANPSYPRKMGAIWFGC